MKKRIMALMLVLVLAVCGLSACTTKEAETTAAGETQKENESTTKADTGTTAGEKTDEAVPHLH